MLSLLILLFTVVPAIEIYLLFTIGGQIGGFNTLLIIIFTGIFGAALAKSQGLSILYHIQKDLNQGIIPTDRFIHGLLVFGGGLLLLTPGFLTDILGLLMVAPGSRNIITIWLKHYFTRAIASGNIRFATFHDFKKRQENTADFEDDHIDKQTKGPKQVDANTFEAEYKKKE